MTTFAPSCAKSVAIAAPMPCELPVTSATLPWRLLMGSTVAQSLETKWFEIKAFDIDAWSLGAAQPRGRYRGRMPARLVVLVSGAGTNLQALLDVSADEAYGAQVVAVGADRDGIEGLARAERAGVPAFIHRVKDFPSRGDWDLALTESCAAFDPDLVVSAGFMKIVGRSFLGRFGGRFINTHPALLPSFPGMHGVPEALEYGVKVTGCTVFLVDGGTDTGPVIAQVAVPVHDDDDTAVLTERVKVAERSLLVETVGRMARAGWSIQGRKVRLGR
jgi:phosphoribosylglycinamide formyltransferase-1